jgi:phosphatidylserine/phosphatidylglycerophosphate/cardiolipin synthase-like enzyme
MDEDEAVRPTRLLRLGRRCLLFWLMLLISATMAPSAASAAAVHFSPNGNVRQELIHAIQHSWKQIDVAVYHITSLDLARALASAHARIPVRVLTDREKAEANGTALKILREKRVAVRTLGVVGQSLMHHKFAVFDRRLVATGSYNWTQTAERANFENLVFLDDPDAVARFQREFDRLWSQAGP